VHGPGPVPGAWICPGVRRAAAPGFARVTRITGCTGAGWRPGRPASGGPSASRQRPGPGVVPACRRSQDRRAVAGGAAAAQRRISVRAAAGPACHQPVRAARGRLQDPDFVAVRVSAGCRRPLVRGAYL